MLHETDVIQASGPSAAATWRLAVAMETLRPPGVLMRHRFIAPGDEHGLFPEELAPIANAVLKVRRQSGAARRIARGLLAELGFSDVSLPPRRNVGVAWPDGVAGSLSHDCDVAVAAVTRVGRIVSLGIDVEPAEPLPAGLAERIATTRERRQHCASVLESRVLFSAKEAVFKALFPVDGVFLDFHDIEIDLAAGLASVPGGREVRVRVIAEPRVVALAVLV